MMRKDNIRQNKQTLNWVKIESLLQSRVCKQISVSELYKQKSFTNKFLKLIATCLPQDQGWERSTLLHDHQVCCSCCDQALWAVWQDDKAIIYGTEAALEDCSAFAHMRSRHLRWLVYACKDLLVHCQGNGKVQGTKEQSPAENHHH